MSELHHKDNLEVYIKRKADEHKMYPSDEVWTNIRRQINTPKKWPALSVFTVCIIAALVIGTVLNKRVPDTVTANFHFALQLPVIKPDAIKPAEKEVLPDEHYSAQKLTSKTIKAAVEDLESAKTTATNDEIQPVVQLFIAKNTNPDVSHITASTKPELISNNQSINKFQQLAAKPIFAFSSLHSNDYLFDITARLKNLLDLKKDADNHRGGVAFFQPEKKYNSDDNDFSLNYQTPYSGFFPEAFYKLENASSRFDFRFYITPSVSYRRLDAAKQKSIQPQNTVASQSINNINPSQAIHQNPALGYETGFGLGYKLSNKFTLTGGLQFNISQYRIDAYLYRNVPVLITLNEGKFSSSFNTTSTLTTTPGNKPLSIKNRYYQISAPVGIDWKIWNNSKFSVGLAGSLQPTYTFDKQPLVISSDYKNYTNSSNYVRNWNLNTNLESYFGYTTGNYRWQIGPQFRYQFLPSLVAQYPTREYLINYGLKVGVVKQLR